MALTLVYSNDLGVTNLSGVIPKNHLAIIEVNGTINPSWHQYGYLYFLADDANLGNRNPMIQSASLRDKGYIYLPKHNYDYKVLFIPKIWLTNVSPKLTLNINISPLGDNQVIPTINDVLDIVKSRSIRNVTPVSLNHTSPTKILSYNEHRTGLLLKNNSNTVAYLSLDNVVTPSDYEYRLAKNDIVQLSLPYTGEVWGICDVNTALIGGIEFIDEQAII